ncbi:hypothetical protein ACFZB6_23515 [Streptomyces syringium]
MGTVLLDLQVMEPAQGEDLNPAFAASIDGNSSLSLLCAAEE